MSHNGIKRGRSPSPANGAAKKINIGYGSSGQTYSGSDVKSRNTAASTVAGARMDPSSIAGLPATPVAAARTEDGQLKDAGNTAAPMSQSTAAGEESAVPSINIKALIVTQDASIIIGKGGSHIKEIREKAGAKVSVSEQKPGCVERILHVTGPLDAVSKAYGLIVRKINDEPYDQPSVPGSRAVTIKYIIPNHRMGSIIGKAGAKIKEIQEASGARLQASETMLQGSTERTLSVSGVADAVHIAVYYVGTILQEGQDRPNQNIAYVPGGAPPIAGGYAGPPAPYGGPSATGSRYGGPPPPRGNDTYYGSAAPAYSGGGQAYNGSTPVGTGYAGSSAVPSGGAAGSQTQQIYVPNDLVGNIIGKGGAKINEIRQMSGCSIKIMEVSEGQGAGAGPNERLVTISGMPHNIQTAVQMLHARLESEKAKKMQSTPY